MDKQLPNRTHLILRRILTVVVVLALLVAVRLVLGSKEMMYLSARDIDHIEVTVNPDGLALSAYGDDAAVGVKVLNKTVCYYPQAEEVAGQSVSLDIYMNDGTMMTVVSCGNHCTIDGKGYKTRSADGEALVQWAQALAEKQSTQS